MDLGLINAFLGSEPANDTEKLVQANVQNLNDTYNKLFKQRNELAAALKKAEEELLKVSGALENQLNMAEFLARQKGLQPVQPSQTQTEQASEEVTEAVKLD